MFLKSFQIFKPESSTFDEIQDRYAISKDMSTIAVADGTTQGYRSEIWAQHLVDEFIKSPTFTKIGFQNFINDIPGIDHLIGESTKGVNQSLEWLTKQKKEEGSSAAFLGVQLDKEKGKYKAIAYGDCKLLIVRGNKILSSFPGTDHVTFINSLNREMKGNLILSTHGNLNHDDRLIIATDAFADFILSDRKRNIKTLSNLNSFKDFINLVEKSFKNKVLEMDDITLIDIYLDHIKKVQKFEPPSSFKYKEQLIPIKKPELYIDSDIKDEEMRKLLEILRFEKSELEGDVSDYKKMTSYLLVMNLVQWVIIMTFILYLVIPEIYDRFKTQLNKASFIVKTGEKHINENIIEKKNELLEKPYENLEAETKEKKVEKGEILNSPNDQNLDSKDKK